MLKKAAFLADFITSEQEFSSTATKLLSLGFLLVAAGITLMQFRMGQFFGLREKTVSITPTLVAGAVAIALLVPLYARGILRWSKSVYGLVTFFLLWTVFSAVIQMAIQGKMDIPEYLVLAAVALSWLGMRGIAGIAWILAFAACIISVIEVNSAMGVWGFLFIASGFIGCLLHSGLSPAHFVEDVRQEYQGFSLNTAKQISGDVRAAKDLL